jgi:hypothetical protein
MSSDSPTRPSPETRAAEAEDAEQPAGADRPPTEDEARQAEQQQLDPDVAEHEHDMQERGVEQEGEGRIP